MGGFGKPCEGKMGWSQDPHKLRQFWDFFLSTCHGFWEKIWGVLGQLLPKPPPRDYSWSKVINTGGGNPCRMGKPRKTGIKKPPLDGAFRVRIPKAQEEDLEKGKLGGKRRFWCWFGLAPSRSSGGIDREFPLPSGFPHRIHPLPGDQTRIHTGIHSFPKGSPLGDPTSIPVRFPLSRGLRGRVRWDPPSIPAGSPFPRAPSVIPSRIPVPGIPVPPGSALSPVSGPACGKRCRSRGGRRSC